MTKTPTQVAPKKVAYRIVSEDPLTKADLIALFKSKDIEIFKKYLVEKRLTAIISRGEAPVEESEFRRGGIMMLAEIMRDLESLNAQVKASIQKKNDLQKA